MNQAELEILKGLISIVKCYNGKFSDLDIKILKGVYEIVNALEEPERWITVKGNHIPIFKGETKEQAIQDFLSRKQFQEPQADGIVEDIGNVVSKAIEYTTCETKEPAYKYPKTIAGAVRKLPMTFEQADKGHSNPYYDKDNYAYSYNCQSCVVAYEARRRGYNVQAAPRQRNDKTAQLAANAAWAWIDPNTNKKCKFNKIDVKNSEELYNWLQKNIKPNARYEFGYNWKDENNKLHGHVLVIEKDNNNNLQIFDPQTGRLYRNRNFKIFIANAPIFSYLNAPVKPRILRIDDKNFNPYFINDVVKSY